MFSFGRLWRKFMGVERIPEHCPAHSKYLANCSHCRSAEAHVAKTWGRYWNYGGVQGEHLSPPSSDAASVPPSSDSGFSGFGGGESGGGGASGSF
jgi:uncharacterized membrane protein YgcG